MIARRGVDRAVGVVGQRLGRAEDAEQPVAEELVRAAAVRLEHGHDDAEELVQQRDRLARRGLVGEAREVADVDEEHRDHRVLAVHAALLSHSETWAGWTVSAHDARAGRRRAPRGRARRAAARRTPRASARRRSGGGRSAGRRPPGCAARRAEQRRDRERRDRDREARLPDRQPDEQHEREVGRRRAWRSARRRPACAGSRGRCRRAGGGGSRSRSRPGAPNASSARPVSQTTTATSMNRARLGASAEPTSTATNRHIAVEDARRTRTT